MASPSRLLLQKLDKILSEVVLKEKPRDLSSDPEYLEQHKQYRTKGNWRLVEANTSTVAEVVCEMLEAQEPTFLPFRLCSVGCGNGEFDRQALEKVLSKFPETKLHYVGIEINGMTCQKAEECLRRLPGVTVVTRAGNIQEMDVTAIEQSFDVVMCINSLYYMRLDIALERCMKMKKPQGKFIIINSGRDPFNDLCGRFWLHQNKAPLMFTPEIKQALSAMGVNFVHKSSNSCMIDFTEYFEDDFQKTYQKHILNFVVQVNIEVYPPAVVQLVKDYLWSIAEGTPEKVLVLSTHDVIVVMSQQN